MLVIIASDGRPEEAVITAESTAGIRAELRLPVTHLPESRLLPELHLPPEGRHPTAFIVICHDRSIAENAAPYRVDVGIAAEAIVLAASEAGFASCMIGSFNAGKVSEALSLADDLAPALVIALGKCDEKIVLTEAANGDVKYYRDAEGTHYVPKRSADEVILR